MTEKLQKKPTLVVDNSDAQNPLDLRNNPIIIFLGAAVAVGGMLLILAASMPAEQVRMLGVYKDWGRLP